MENNRLTEYQEMKKNQAVKFLIDQSDYWSVNCIVHVEC